jgi:YidC/Oxa1 family membrane protein insertase
MEQFDWKRYFLFLTIAFAVFIVYDYFFASKHVAQSHNQTQKVESVGNRTQKVQTVQQTTSAVSLYLGSEREKFKPEHFITVDAKDALIKISEEGAKIVSFYDKRFKKELIEDYERAYNIYPLEILTPSWNTTALLNFSRYNCKKSGYEVVCRLDKNGIKVVKKFVFTRDGYLAELDIQLEGVKNPYLYLGMNPKEEAFYTHIGPIVKTSTGQVIRINIEDITSPKVLHGSFVWVGEEGRYFLKAAKYETKTAIFYRISYLNKEGKTEYASAAVIAVKPTAKVVYLEGPKEYELLKQVGFVEAIDFGVLHFLAYPTFLVLYFFYKLTHSWVAAIFILTLLIRIVFFPLSISSVRSMKKMQELAPKIEEIRKKYANDPQKMQAELLKLYKEGGFNPFGGCLPILIQIPIFFALYKVLIVTPDLALEGFLWIPSLADKDPYYILPVLMGLTMIAQSWITPSPNKQQNTMMYLMAIVFTFLFANFPAGLVLYWTLNNIFNLIQTWIVYKYLS